MRTAQSDPWRSIQSPYPLIPAQLAPNPTPPTSHIPQHSTRPLSARPHLIVRSNPAPHSILPQHGRLFQFDLGRKSGTEIVWRTSER
ncbi:hypothetical protein BDV93DRAFT_523475 [Ceratobasidium sp. AG-I]|nr:hypothetical protein BDV93DRAFT_523475 [Ceratobasidium sp. AG-I]